uniref:Activator of Hsp90 ATPase AHSA1-like N-terminal domain-containing protein n=1 Tax=Populus davidiana TaxID=266767 RepID=A0A6M2F4P1_9ROSI
MENGGGGDIECNKDNKEKEGSVGGEGSYRYWVREATADAAPLPLPKKLSPQDHLPSQPNNLGSVWNTAGTWEEKNLNNWATHRIKELLLSVASLEFSGGKAEIAQVSKCSGDAFLVIVRNKKRVGYTYELTLKVKGNLVSFEMASFPILIYLLYPERVVMSLEIGEWTVKEEKRMVKGDIDFPEFSFGELDDLQMQVQLNDEKDLSQQDKLQISQDLKLFLQPVREKLLQFEQELKDR